MSIQNIPPKPTGNSWVNYAQRLGAYLQQTRSILRRIVSGESASENGILLWDESNGYPVVSKNNVWRQVVLADGRANLKINSDVTAASADTAYALTYTGTKIGINLSGSQIQFVEGGEYIINFSAQISSTSSSTVHFMFWPKINGTDVADSTIIGKLHNNNATLVISRSQLFTVNAGDYLEAMWSTDSTSGFLNAVAATSYAPAAPASTISITRVAG
jgi:hypothetical protein